MAHVAEVIGFVSSARSASSSLARSRRADPDYGWVGQGTAET
jgi:hypothetical protein